MGYKVFTHNFEAPYIKGRKGENIYAFLKGEIEEYIIIASHYDSRSVAEKDKKIENRNKPIDGANDGASSSGVLLELMNSLKNEKLHYGICFILFDLEDDGNLFYNNGNSLTETDWIQGSIAFVNDKILENEKIKFGILLDMVGGYNAKFKYESLAYAYYPNIYDKIWEYAKSLGFGNYFINEHYGIITDDHIPFIMNKIPFIDIIDMDYKYHHTSEDTIDKIAGLYDVSVEEIAYINQIPYPYRLAVGEALLIPDGVSSGVKMTASANGYAYPYISPWVLRQTLPYMSGLLVFSYGFTEEGELIQPVPSDDAMRRMAAEYGRNAYLTLTPIGPDGKFSNSRIHAVLTSEESTERLLSGLQREVREKNFRGVDVDFEYILKEDRDLFTAFVRELRVRMNEEGYLVSVALAPKTSAEQPGLLYEGKDYGGLGEAANQVLLMTYEWGYKYGPPTAVAPLNKVRQVVEYALTEIPSEKILLGVPNYGYDWILPFMRGESQAVTIGHVEAVQIAINNSAVIEFDGTAQSPYFTYERDNVRHEVWFEDVRSLSAKYSLIKEYNLRGMAVWQIMRLFRAMWILFDDFFEKRE